MQTARASFGPWPKGIDNIHNQNQVEVDQFARPQSVTDAVNVNFNFAGYPSSRRGPTLRVAMAMAHSVRETAVGTYFVQSGGVYRLTNYGSYEASLIGVLNSNHPASFDNFQGGAIVSNQTSLMRITAAGLFPLAVTDGVACSCAATTNGGLPAGRYGVACAFVNTFGLEGSLPPIRFVDVPEGGGITAVLPSAPDAVSVRVFRTNANGKTLMRAFDAAPGTIVLLGADTGDGEEPIVAPAKQARAMPPGDFVNNWRSRTLVARGRFLYHSEPFAPHLCSKLHGFTQFARKIVFVRGVESGVFVGTKDDVLFLAGERPEDWKVVSTGGQPAAARGALVVDGANLDEAYQLAGQEVAVWLSTSGFVFGTSEGRIIEPQARRFKNALPQKASLALDDINRRLTAVLT